MANCTRKPPPGADARKQAATARSYILGKVTDLLSAGLHPDQVREAVHLIADGMDPRPPIAVVAQVLAEAKLPVVNGTPPKQREVLLDKESPTANNLPAREVTEDSEDNEDSEGLRRTTKTPNDTERDQPSQATVDPEFCPTDLDTIGQQASRDSEEDQADLDEQELARRAAVKRKLADFLLWIIREYEIPEDIEEWQHTHHLMRVMMGHRDVRHLNGEQAFRRLDKALKTLVGRGVDPWTYFGADLGTEENAPSWKTFIEDKWNSIKVAVGESWWTEGVALAKRNPIKPAPTDRHRGNEEYGKFVTLALWLQVLRGADPIIAPLEKWSRHFGVTKKCVSTWRRWACDAGILLPAGKTYAGADRYWATVDAVHILVPRAEPELLEAIKEARNELKTRK